MLLPVAQLYKGTYCIAGNLKTHYFRLIYAICGAKHSDHQISISPKQLRAINFNDHQSYVPAKHYFMKSMRIERIDAAVVTTSKLLEV